MMMAYLLVIFWMGGASITVIEPPLLLHPRRSEISGLRRCVQMAHSIRKHFKKNAIIKIKCVPERMPRK